MKGWENFTDLYGIAVGMLGALIKSIKKKMSLKHKLMGMVVAGILCYTSIGVVQMFYGSLPERISILIAFIVGWTANEITDKMDIFVDDLYEYCLGWLNKKNKNE